MIKCLIFDLDGTIIDSIEGIRDSINESLNTYNIDSVTKEDVLNYIGDGQDVLLKRSMVKSREYDNDEIDLKLYNNIKEKYEALYKKNRINGSKPFDGIIDVLKYAKDQGIKIALLSNKPDNDSKAIIEYFFPGVFDVIFGARPNVCHKPDPQGVYEILSILNISADEALFVGDSRVDMQTAINAKIDQIAVTYGYEKLDVLLSYKPKYVASRPIDIIDIMKKRED